MKTVLNIIHIVLTALLFFTIWIFCTIGLVFFAGGITGKLYVLALGFPYLFPPIFLWVGYMFFSHEHAGGTILPSTFPYLFTILYTFWFCAPIICNIVSGILMTTGPKRFGLFIFEYRWWSHSVLLILACMATTIYCYIRSRRSAEQSQFNPA